MINEICVNLYCREDISLIENYDKAINDNTQTWDCHHRRETDDGLSLEQLKEQNLYYDRPANELIFLTKSEHNSLHHKNKQVSEEARRKNSESNKGRIPWNKGLKMPEETRKKQSEALKGENHPMYGKPSPNKGKHRVYDENGKYHLEF